MPDNHRHCPPVAVGPWLALSILLLVAGCTTTVTTTKAGAGNSVKSSPAPKPKKPAAPSPAEAEAAAVATAVEQVTATEQAFAQTMADRNFQGFVSLLSPEVVFFSGTQVHRGSEAVAGSWQQYFAGPKAPFSWRPDHVEVLASGKLALSTGPVYQNNVVVGRFNSIWRLEAPNTWRIVFDKGEAVCNVLPSAP